MRFLKTLVLMCFTMAMLLPAGLRAVGQQSPADTVVSQTATEAPTGFDNLSNGLFPQTQFAADQASFDEHEAISDGLGPVYNAQGCSECHQNPVSGGSSQVLELRAGHFDGTDFTASPGGSLIHSRAIDALVQEQVGDGYEVRAFRSSVNTLGDGFVEAIADETLINIARNQPGQSRGRISGEVVMVPVLEAPVAMRVGRFGWKDQHASLLSFSADAYLNEMGITSPMLPTENFSNGNSVSGYDAVADPEDNDGADVEAFTRYIRATKAPPRNATLAATPAAQAGSELFDQLGCAICHVRSITTAPAGTLINGGQLTVSAVLGDKIIHPFGDFLLHNIGTGDGIVQNGPPTTRNKLRTAPLWGLRTRNQFMHDGQSLTLNGAILRHGGEAAAAINSYRRLSDARRAQLITFLRSL
ncbi:MAG TPA: di-heme oxidoredictase family protein [Blastocatellia bacterium]|nr:di-heme oxidoredictase family protein [Blastocatellia bacterium]